MNRPRKILVVEDENIVALDIRNRLKNLGYEVLSIAHSGEQAVEYTSKYLPDLVLMDIMLKGEIDGIEAANFIRGQHRIPVIYLTAFADQSTFERAKISEPYGYILKPFEERELYTSIEMALYKHEIELKLKEREQWLETTLKSIGDGIIATDNNNHITFMNPVAVALTGWEQKDALHKNLSDVFQLAKISANGEDDAEDEPDITSAAAFSKVSSHPLISKDNNRVIHIDYNVAPIKDEKENLIGKILVFRDMSERQLAQKALMESEDKFRRITNSAHDAIIMIDKNENITYWNKAAEKIFGYCRDELLGEGVFKLLSNTTNFKETLAKLRQQKNSQNSKASSDNTFELMALRKNGNVFPIEISISAVRIKGELNGVAIIRDITERKRTELALKQEKERAELLYKVVPSAIFTADKNGVITSFNDKASQISGYKPDEIIGKSCSLIEAIMDGECKLLCENNLQPAIGVECHIKRKDGKIRIISKNTDILNDSLGNTTGHILSFEDITERKQAELELQRAKEAAEAATIAKSQFLANMSHEIRTPMNAVIGMTGLMLGTELDDEQKEYAETIRNSGEHLLTLINDILDFSKIESGNMRLENQPFNIRECVEESLDLHRTQASEKNLELSYIVSDKIPRILRGDVTRIRQILNNLINNAVKFTEKGEIFVGVDLEETTSQKHRIHFSVKDTGIGIPKEKIGSLFQSFTQVDSSITRKFGGTGLGLAISKHLVEMMGGKMWVESQMGIGSEFHFTIQTEVMEGNGKPHFAAEDGVKLFSGKNLLIVDDNATNRKVVSTHVKSWGIIPTEASSGREALKLIVDKQNFDIAVLDMQLPEMDGMTLAREIKKIQNGRTMPLIMLSSIGNREIRDNEKIFSAFLTKPVKQIQLYKALEEIFSNLPAEPKAIKPPVEIDSEMAKRLPMRILLAEDNVVNQKLAIRILQKLGYRADVASDGNEVLQALERQPYDVVFMDVQMPEMDGLEATRRIRQHWKKQRPYIIAMTALAMEGDKERCLEAGMDDYISKPIRIQELIDALSSSQSDAVKIKHEVQDQAIDMQVLENLKVTLGDDDDQVFIELIEIFLDDAPNLINDINTSVKEDDLEKLIRASHTLKTSSATVGAMKLSVLCKKMEHDSRSNLLDDMDQQALAIDREHKIADKKLREIIAH